MARRIVDLGLKLTPGLKTWDVKPPFTMLPYMTASTFTLGFCTKLLVMEDHTGTHVDAPFHFYDGERRAPVGKTIEHLPIERFLGEAVLVDVSAKAPKDPVDEAMLRAAVRDQRVEIRRGDMVLIRAWDRPWGEPMQEFLDCRVLTGDASEWLLALGVRLVGVDHPNLEGAVKPEFGNMDCPGHCLFLHPDNEVLIVENLVNLDRIRARRFLFAGFPIHIQGATGSPIRAVAIIDE